MNPRPRHTGRQCALTLVLATVIAGCGAGWRRTELSIVNLEPRQQLQVWTGNKAVQWHGVRVMEDAVSGIPFFQPLGCDSCRQAIPRVAVDSVRVGDPDAGYWKSLGLGVGVILVFCMVFCSDYWKT